MTGIYQDYQLQEMRKIRIALEKIANSLEKIDKDCIAVEEKKEGKNND